MAPRPRNPRNKLLPDGLRERDGYYSYRHPDGTEYGLGRNKRSAVSQAMTANMKLAGVSGLSLIDRIEGVESRTWAKGCDEFWRILTERELRPATMKARKSQLARLRSMFEPSKALASIGTLEVSGRIEAIKKEGKARTAQIIRTLLIDFFDRMIAAGWRTDNPARVTDPVRVKVKRARLTLETFMAIYNGTSKRWLRNAMALALVSAQDRDSCGKAKFTDIRENCWWNERTKTGARMILPLELRLDAFGMSLGDVVRQCRTTGVVSRYLIHQADKIPGITLGKAVNIETITRAFTAEIEKLSIDWGDRHPPTFHEIRSLAARLYKQEGRVDPQALLAHRDPATTSIYTDGRGEWVRVAVK